MICVGLFAVSVQYKNEKREKERKKIERESERKRVSVRKQRKVVLSEF